MLRRALTTAFVFLALSAVSSLAQTPGPEPATASDASLTVTAGYEAHRDRLRYEFTSPSSFNTAFLVPHSFEQKYVGDNQWFVVSARYPVAGDSMETEVAVAPERQTSGSDFDTFDNPGNDIVVSGTDGDVRMRSLRLTHWSETRLWGLPWRLGYTYRRDRAEFLPADIVVTHTNPPSETRRFTTDRETTISQVHELMLDVSKPMALTATWSAVAGVTVSPLVRAKLTTILPDKYPGQDIVFELGESAAAVRLQFAHRRGARLVLLGITWGGTWSYSGEHAFDRNSLNVSIRVGMVRR